MASYSDWPESAIAAFGQVCASSPVVAPMAGALLFHTKVMKEPLLPSGSFQAVCIDRGVANGKMMAILMKRGLVSS